MSFSVSDLFQSNVLCIYHIMYVSALLCTQMKALFNGKGDKRISFKQMEHLHTTGKLANEVYCIYYTLYTILAINMIQYLLTAFISVGDCRVLTGVCMCYTSVYILHVHMTWCSNTLYAL
jgi:hypothetical protein